MPELKIHVIKILSLFDSFKLYGRLFVNPKTGYSRKLFLLENEFKSFAELWMPTDPTKM